MRTVVHLSDLHFGRVDARLVTPLVQAIEAIGPHLVAISGDLTQRARRHEFLQARDFLQQLHFPQLIVPGNHDVPLYNIPARWLRPLAGYGEHISPDFEPVFADEEMIVVGLNSVRSATLGGRGRLNALQVDRAATRLMAVAPHVVKIVVTHHPFDLPHGHGDDHLIGGSQMAMARLAPAGAQVFLAGHLHVSHTGGTAERYKIAGHDALVVQAGTLSTRGRGEVNSFNVVQIDRPQIVIERHSWDEKDGTFRKSWSGTWEPKPAW